MKEAVAKLEEGVLVAFKNGATIATGDFQADLYGNFRLGHMASLEGEKSAREMLHSYLKEYAMAMRFEEAGEPPEPRAEAYARWFLHDEQRKRFLSSLFETMKDDVPDGVLPTREELLKLRVRWIGSRDKAKVDRARARVRTREDFLQLVKDPEVNDYVQYSESVIFLGDGMFSMGDEKQLLAMEPGDISEVMGSPMGWFFVLIEEVIEPTEAQVREAVKEARMKYLVSASKKVMETAGRSVNVERVDDASLYEVVKAHLFDGQQMENEVVARVGDFTVYFKMLLDDTPELYNRVTLDREYYFNMLRQRLDTIVERLTHASVAGASGVSPPGEAWAANVKSARKGLYIMAQVLEKQRSVSDSQIREFFQWNKEQLLPPTQAVIIDVAVVGVEKARQLASDLERNPGADEFVLQRFAPHLTESYGGDKTVSYSDLGDEVGGTVFSEGARAGEAHVFRHEGGHRVIYVRNYIPAAKETFEDIKGFVKRFYWEARRQHFVDQIYGENLEQYPYTLNEEELRKVIAEFAEKRQPVPMPSVLPGSSPPGPTGRPGHFFGTTSQAGSPHDGR